MLEDYIYDNCPQFWGKITKDVIKRLITQQPDKLIIIKNSNEIKGVGFYFRLSDRTLELIKTSKFDTTILSNVIQCLNENGHNIHFAFIVAKGLKTILKGLRKVIKRESAKTVSWYSEDRLKFNIFNVGGRDGAKI